MVDYVIDKDNKHLGGNISYGDISTYAPSVWNYLIDRFSVESVLDLGSGGGYASHYFFNKGLKVVAIEGMHDNVIKSKFPAVKHDLTTGPVFTKVDLVHCQEVVEHIEEKYIDHLIDSMCCGKFLVMTHALPGQDGYHHVNLQPTEYWVDHLSKKGMILLVDDTNKIRRLAGQDGAAFLNQSGLVFANPNLL